jgi:hypothetical protein
LTTAALALVAGARCSSSSGNTTPTDDAGTDAVPDTDPGDAQPDTTPDAGPVTCTKPPAFGTAIRVSHNPDSLRLVSNATVAGLPDGKVLVVLSEASDAAFKSFAIWARTVDPTQTTPVASEDERLDVDADALASGNGLRLSTLANGAVVAQWRGGVANGARLRVYQHGKWSPELLGPSSAMPTLDGDTVSFAGTPDGSVMVARTRSAAPAAAAVVYHPDEGGPRGSWSTPQTLDLDGGTGTPTLQIAGRADGSYLAMIWHGTGGPAVRTRSPSGAWSTASARADIGARDAQPDSRLLDDGSLVLVALESAAVDTRLVVTTTWTASGGWTPARLLSKLPSANGVIPYRSEPYLFSLGTSKAEFLAWVAGCATVAKDCEFHAISRTYDPSATQPWGDPKDLAVGPTLNGIDYAHVVALDGGRPLIWRGNIDANQIDFAVRLGDTWSTPTNLLSGPAGSFDGGIKTNVRFYGNAFGFYGVAKRVNSAGNPLPTLMAKISPSATPPGNWASLVESTAEYRQDPGGNGYVDGAGGFTVAVNDAVDGPNSVPLLAHDFGAGASPNVLRVISTDESSAAFSNVPGVAPRATGQDRSAIYLVSAQPTGGGGGNRLRAYAFNGQGTGVVQKQLANETRSPKSFGQSVLATGCGGAIVYAVDPADGSHAAELVLVQ